MATHSSILAWKIPWTEKTGGLESTGSQRIRHDGAHTKKQWIFVKEDTEIKALDRRLVGTRRLIKIPETNINLLPHYLPIRRMSKSWPCTLWPLVLMLPVNILAWKPLGSSGLLNISCRLSLLACMLSRFSHVWLFVTLWTVTCQAPLSMRILQARILEWVVPCK